jgi:tRNA G18 (ribose-2'-O)-methylase SpoU
MAICVPEAKFVENVGGIVRSANAFLIETVILDSATYNKAASVGSAKWENIRVVGDVLADATQLGYPLIALEQNPCSIPLWEFRFPRRCALVLGHEVRGMPDETLELCHASIEIPQYGVVESLNLATATGIALYEYSRQHR